MNNFCERLDRAVGASVKGGKVGSNVGRSLATVIVGPAASDKGARIGETVGSVACFVGAFVWY